MLKVLTMVYNTSDYWVLGVFLSPDIKENRNEHNVSETGFVSFLR
jgi:hypothetical protein